MERIKAEIHDRYNVWQKTLYGNFDKGAFTFYDGGFKIFSFTINGVLKKLDCDLTYSWRHDTGVFIKDKSKYVRYDYDGHNYKQSKFGSNQKDSNIDLYLSDIEKGMLAKELSLEKPMDLKTLIEFMFFFLVIVAGIGIYFMVDNINQAVKPMANISIALQHHQTLLDNQTLQLYKLYNQSYNFNKGLFTYLQSHGG